MPICLKFSNVPSVFGSLPTKAVVEQLVPIFELAIDRGVRLFWADELASSQCALGALLARLDEDVDATEILLDLMSADRNVFEYLTYIAASFDRLWVHSVDCVMVGTNGGSIRKFWPPYEKLGHELLKRKLAYGCGATLLHANQLATADKQTSIKRVCIPLKAVNRELQPSLKGIGKRAVVMVDNEDADDRIKLAFTSGCTICVDVLRTSPGFAKKIVEGYGVEQ